MNVRNTWIKVLVVCLCMVGVLAFGVPALADWNPGDGHKMHFPQLPDEDGWNVKSSHLVPAPD